MKLEQVQAMKSYCEQICISENIRLDLFTAESFRIRFSDLNGEPFPKEYEIPFAIGKTTPWKRVKYTADCTTDSTIVAVKTEKLHIFVRKNSGTFIVETPEGKRLYPENAPRFGMFKNHCIVFDSANFWNDETNCSRYAHWFYNPKTELYDILLKDDKLFDIYFIYAETYKKGYALFNELVGAEPMLPRKGYGYYQTQHLSWEGSQSLLLRTAELLRERDIPCDTLIIDFEWGDGADGGKEQPWGSRLDWSSEYCKPYSIEKMLQILKEQHFDVMTIRHSIPEYNGRFDEEWVCEEFDADLWWSKMQEQLNIGVVGTWQDTRQTDVTNARIYSGLEKRTKKRVSMLSNYDLYRDSSWTKDCVFTPRKQKIGGRRTPFYWTGDAKTETWEDLRCQLNGIVNEHGALKGISYITNDGFRPGGITLGVRSDQFLALSAVARSHSCKPWEAPKNANELAERMAIDKEKESVKSSHTADELLGLTAISEFQEDIIRKFLKLRYSLLPYIYSTARECYDTGLPITRPLMVAFEEDTNCNCNQYPYEYMLGNDILVCPVYDNCGKMQVYLPPGCNWINFFDGTTFAGGKSYSVDTSDLSQLPLFIRCGAIIPMRKDKNWIDGEDNELILKIFGSESGECVLYEDDGFSLEYRNGKCAFTKISFDAKAKLITINAVRGDYANMKPQRKISVIYNKKTKTVLQNKYETIEISLK